MRKIAAKNVLSSVMRETVAKNVGLAPFGGNLRLFLTLVRMKKELMKPPRLTAMFCRVTIQQKDKRVRNSVSATSPRKQ